MRRESRSEGHDVALAGAPQVASAPLARLPLRLSLPVRGGVRVARHGGGTGVGAGEQGGDERAPGGHWRGCRTGPHRRFGGRWCGSRALALPDNVVLLKLPPRTPGLDPMETAFQYPKNNRLANRAFADVAAVADACRKIGERFAVAPERIAIRRRPSRLHSIVFRAHTAIKWFQSTCRASLAW